MDKEPWSTLVKKIKSAPKDIFHASILNLGTLSQPQLKDASHFGIFFDLRVCKGVKPFAGPAESLRL